MKQQTQGNELVPAGAAAAEGRAGTAPEAGAPDLARRSFLRAAPLGALAVVAGSAAAAETPAAAPVAPELDAKRGYHETDHIRRYYQTAAYW
ncbi:formate dehydrogenase [Telluria aromaticivorans]|uniref:Formate dehydrogenase n=1 Tax=Telluria aromaticivorans TaxID=2725995 RepID=A0A7Y2NYD5_9BURK|nr:formate dehydrogenase [Telluria aromaticivorans]NNG21943.1 formate dehydrogenase [Telluria aromaticivorans]